MPEPNILRVLSTRNSEHYTWREHCDGWYLLKDKNLHVIQERMPPGAAEVMHFHGQFKQLFYVLRGVLTMRTEWKSVTIPAGQAVVVEPLHRTRQATNLASLSIFSWCPRPQVTEADSIANGGQMLLNPDKCTLHQTSHF